MKIKKRNNTSPSATAPMWAIPSFTYFMGKLGGMNFNEFEFIWWILLPILLIGWATLNYKIENENK